MSFRIRNHGTKFRAAALVALLIVFSLNLTIPLRAQNAAVLPPSLQDVGIDQKLNAQVPLDLTFNDEKGARVRLGDYFGQKPVILSLVYYECPMLCTMVLNGMLHTLQAMSFNVGDQFNVVTVSFNPQEKPSLAEAKKKVYVGLYGRPGAENGWHFLTGDEPNIKRLADAVGFRYKYDPDSGQYSHATGIMVLTPDGRISKYFYGIEYKERDVRLGLVDASQRKIGSPVDQLWLFCCQYDPRTGKYGLIITRVIQLAGGATLLILATALFVLFRIDRRRMKHGPAATKPAGA